MSKPAGARFLLLDACTVINFVACRRFEDLARFHGGFRIADLIEQEAHFVRKGGAGDDAQERERIVFAPLIADGSLIIESISNESERSTFSELAVPLSDGDAVTLALALHRGHAVVTDDRKAARIAREQGITVVATLELIKQWAEGIALDARELRQALIDLRERGRYLPARSHPLRAWWEQAVAKD